MKKRMISIVLAFIFMFTLSTDVFAADPPPDLIGRSAISFDLDTNEIIYTKNIDSKSFPASITKLMTALLLAENKNKNDMLTYTESAKIQEPYSYDYNLHPVNVGDEMAANMVMDTLLLFSANDMAYMAADNVGGNTENFINMMNERAKQLGMTHTHFVTANGLDDDTDDHYTTAYDLTKLTKAVYNNPWTKESMNKKTSVVNFINGGKATLTNRNKLLGIDGCIAGKTGYTDKAGRCLVTIYERNGRHLIGVVLNSEYDKPEDTKVFEDMKELVNWSYQAKKDTLLTKNTIVKTIPLSYKPLPFLKEKTVDVPLEIKEDITYYNNDITPEQKLELSDIDVSTLDNTTSYGTLTITQRDYTKSYPLYATITKENLKKQDMPIYIGFSIGSLLFIIFIVIIVLLLKRKFKKRRRYKRRKLL